MGLIFNGNNGTDTISATDGSLVIDGLDLGGVGNINAGIGTFSGNLNVGGVLTYEDVKNVDSVGIVTARAGIKVTGGNINIENAAPRIDLTDTGANPDFSITNTDGNFDVTDLTNTATRLRITTDGKFGFNTSTPYAYDTTATTFEVKGSVSSAADTEVARFRGGSDADGGTAVLRLTNDNDRGLVVKGGRESSASEFAEFGVSSFNGTYTRVLKLTAAGQVGIGTATPTYGSHLHGTGASNNAYYMAEQSSAGASAGFRLKTTGSHFAMYGAVSGSALGIYDYNAGAERFTIDSGGRVGVGTFAPHSSYRFDIRDNSNVYLHLGQGNATLAAMANNTWNALSFQGTNAELGLFKDSSGNFSYIMGTYQGGTAIPVIFRTGNRVERLRIGATGKLSYNYDTSENNLADIDLRTNNGLQIRGHNGNTNNAKLYIGGSVLNQRKTAIIHDPVGGYCRGDLHFCLENAADLTDVDVTDSKMVIKADGKVGINTTIPTGTLEVVDTGEYQIVLKDNNNAGQGAEMAMGFKDSANTVQGWIGFNQWENDEFHIANANSGGHIIFHTHNGSSVGERLRIDSTGKIGINYAASPPSETIHISQATGHSAASVSLSHLSGGNRYGARLSSLGSTDAGIAISSFFNSVYTERFRIKSNGQIVLGSDGTNSELTFSQDGTSGTILNSTTTGFGGYNTFTVNSAAFVHTYGSNERMRITSAGNVLIGNTNGSEKLDVTGWIQSTSGFKTAGHPIATYASFTDISGGSYATRLGSTGTSTLRSTQIYGGGSHIATFDGVNKRLGINITAPAATLHLAGPSEIRFNNATDAGNFARIRCFEESSNNHAILAFHVGSGEALRIANDGKILIGNTFNSNSNGFKMSIKETANENAAIVFLDTDNMRGGYCGISKGTNQIMNGDGNVDFVVGSTYMNTHIISGNSGGGSVGSIKATFDRDGHFKNNNVKTFRWGGYILASASVSVNLPYATQGNIYHIKCMFSHYNQGYGAYRVSDLWVYSGHSGIQQETVREYYDSGNGGTWSITRGSSTSDPIVVAKSAGSYNGYGHWWVEATAGWQ